MVIEGDALGDSAGADGAKRLRSRVVARDIGAASATFIELLRHGRHRGLSDVSDNIIWLKTSL